MGRSRKRSVSQNIVNVATTGMPSPLRKTLGNRLVAMLIVFAIPVLLIMGVVSVEWEDGRPRLSFNRERAAEVRENAAEEIDDLRNDKPGFLSLPDKFGDNNTGLSEFGERAEQQLEQFQNRMHHAPEKTATRDEKPFSGFRDQFKNRR